MHRVGLGDDHHAAGVAVEPVHDARPRRSADAAEFAEMKREALGECSGPVAAGRMDDHPRGLVHGDDVLVLVENVERISSGADRRYSSAAVRLRSDRLPTADAPPWFPDR